MERKTTEPEVVTMTVYDGNMFTAQVVEETDKTITVRPYYLGSAFDHDQTETHPIAAVKFVTTRDRDKAAS